MQLIFDRITRKINIIINCPTLYFIRNPSNLTLRKTLSNSKKREKERKNDYLFVLFIRNLYSYFYPTVERIKYPTLGYK